MAPRKTPPAAPDAPLAPAEAPPEHDLSTFGGRLRYARHLRGADGRPVPTKPLSGRAGLSPTAVSFIEDNPSTDVRCGNALALARELNINPAWLAWRVGPVEPFPPPGAFGEGGSGGGHC